MSNLRLFLFGEPRLEYAGTPLEIPRRKGLALLAYLALAEQRQNRDVLATLLWPDLDQEHARAALRSTLSALTTQMPGAWLDSDRSMLSLRREVVWVDVLVFLFLLRESRAHKHEGNTLCDECHGYLREAVDLYQTDFMAGFTLDQSTEYDDWQLVQREWLRRELSYALRRLAAHFGEQADYDTAVAYTNRWLALDSLHEPAHRMLMRLYAASGQRTEALRQYQRCVELLDSELATVPEDETTQLFAAIQSSTVLPMPSGASQAKGKSTVLPPLPTLLVGREHTLGEIKLRLGIGGEDPRPMTIIQGWPGVGKSTTIAALAHDPKVAEHFSDGILWTSLGETPNLLHHLALWAESLGIRDLGREATIETFSTQLTAILRDRRMLLIVDDVWHVEHAAAFKVGGQACAMLLTSRLPEVAQALAPTAFDIYRLAVLGEDKALELLRRLAPDTVALYPEESRELVRDLEGLPLAIQVAGRLLHTEAQLGWGVRDLLDELHAGSNLLQARAPSDMVTLGQEPSPTIAALLKRSTDSLDDETRQRFALLGLFVPKPATFDLGAMAAAWGIIDPKPAARILVNRGLLEPVSGGRFQMHALLVIHARSLLEEMIG